MATILLVEDDRLLRKAIKEELDEAGFKTLVAENSQEVFASLASEAADLILLDVLLPGELNGYDILKKLKADDSTFKDIPVIMLSNLGQLEEIDKALRMGAADYIVKANTDLPRLVEVAKKRLGSY